MVVEKTKSGSAYRRGYVSAFTAGRWVRNEFNPLLNPLLYFAYAEGIHNALVNYRAIARKGVVAKRSGTREMVAWVGGAWVITAVLLVIGLKLILKFA